MDPKTEMELGRDDLKHIAPVREEIARNLGEKSAEVVTPKAELAEKDLGEAEKAGFLKDVAGVQEESEPGQTGITDSSSVLGDLGKNVGNLLPEIGEYDNVQTASSKGANEIELKRNEQMKVK